MNYESVILNVLGGPDWLKLVLGLKHLDSTPTRSYSTKEYIFLDIEEYDLLLGLEFFGEIIISYAVRQMPSQPLSPPEVYVTGIKTDEHCITPKSPFLAAIAPGHVIYSHKGKQEFIQNVQYVTKVNLLLDL